MHHQEQRAWLIVAVLFIVIALCYGTVLNTVGVFVTPLVKAFHWDRAKVSVLTSVVALLSGLSSLVIGWLIDRIEAKFVMAAGVAMASAGYALASEANSFPALVCAHAFLGIGMGAAGLVPASLVIANWFDARRGFALAVAIAGSSAGGLAMNLIISRVIASHGWRVGYMTLAVPMAVVSIPLLLLTIQTRPASSGEPEQRLTVKESSDRLAGFDVPEALRSVSFWMLVAATFLFWFGVNPTETHLIPYLIGLGYRPTIAATIFGLLFPSVLVGKLAMGIWADRITGRRALVIDFVLAAITFLGFIYVAPHKAFIIPLIIFAGFPGGAPLALIPMVQAETLGLKRFGSLAGLIGFAGTLGATIGPIVVGWLFDVMGSYTVPFQMCGVMIFIAALAVFGCSPFRPRHLDDMVVPLATARGLRSH